MKTRQRTPGFPQKRKNDFVSHSFHNFHKRRECLNSNVDVRHSFDECEEEGQVVKKLEVKEKDLLLKYLIQALAPQSATSIKELLKNKCIMVNHSITTQFNHELANGDAITIISRRAKQRSFQHPHVKILYEDDNLIVVNKASGIHSVDSTNGGVENVASLLDLYLKKKNPHHRIYIVHRLDRDTSGVMIFAKTRFMQNKLIENWNQTIEKREYIAIVEGMLEADSGTIDNYLYEDPQKVVHVTQDSKLGLRAITHYKVLKKNAQYTLVKCELDTGRTNQIRVHMKSIGHAVVGDFKYGAQCDPLHRLGLHAENIQFQHPVTGKKCHYEVPVPQSFEDLFDN